MTSRIAASTAIEGTLRCMTGPWCRAGWPPTRGLAVTAMICLNCYQTVAAVTGRLTGTFAGDSAPGDEAWIAQARSRLAIAKRAAGGVDHGTARCLQHGLTCGDVPFHG